MRFILAPIEWCIDREYAAKTDRAHWFYYALGKLYIFVAGLGTSLLAWYIITQVLGIR